MKKLALMLCTLLFVSVACSISGNAATPAPLASNPQQPTDTSVLFQEDFSNTSGEWGKVWDSADGSSVGYADSGYRILENKIQNISWGVSGSNFFEGDVVIEVDAIKKGGATDGFFGIVCRDEVVNGLEHLYFLIFDGNGAASINKLADNSVTTLANAQSDPIPAVNDGSTVHIRAECIGNTLTLYVNDIQLVTATDVSFTGGDAGLIAGTANTPGTDVFFDNFVVHLP